MDIRSNTFCYMCVSEEWNVAELSQVYEETFDFVSLFDPIIFFNQKKAL